MSQQHPLSKPLILGSLVLPNRILYSPLAGCSDLPFRKMNSLYSRRPGLMFCEMVKMDALVRDDNNTFRMLDFSPDMHPIGAQLCGSKPALAGPSAKIIQERGFDVVDLNCGCPVDRVTKDGSGSGLLKNPELIGEIISEMVAAVNIPVTVKIRAGWTEEDIVIEEVVAIAEAAGASAISIHGRTRAQAYRGPANWDYIARAKRAGKKMPVIGNGDVIDAPSAAALVSSTGCDAIMIGRATMGQPWIAENILNSLDQSAPQAAITFNDIQTALTTHFEFILSYYPRTNEHRICVDMRRVGCWYLKGVPGVRKLREKMSRVQTIGEVEAILARFQPEEEDESLEEAPLNTCEEGC